MLQNSYIILNIDRAMLLRQSDALDRSARKMPVLKLKKNSEVLSKNINLNEKHKP